ncbi:MAG: glycoside hydrolase family 97 catalytic domain-containing protein [Bacteroidota bacterium]
MNKTGFICLIIFIFFSATIDAQVATVCKIYSPDKLTSFEAGTDNADKIMYRVMFKGQEVITWSALGFVLNGIRVGEKLTVKIQKQASHREKFAWRLGEDDIIVNNYNQIILSCISSGVSFSIIARVFDGSVAFRYDIPQLKSSINSISKENTVFNFSMPYTIYQYNQESVFTPVAIDTFNNSCDFPATLTNAKLFVSIGEADNENYTKAELKRGSALHSLVPAFIRDTVVKISNGFKSPWRTISVSETAIGLHSFSNLFLRLAAPAAKEIPAWIKPGKLIRSQLNTQSGLDCIDFAANHHFQYIMFDAGWYGAEFRSTSNPTRVISEIDMPHVIQYGKEKGIGVILYVNYAGLRTMLDTILPLYKKWGVRGLKFGFVDGVTQKGISWLAMAIKKVNNFGFILDIHDNYKPTGLSRLYPALLTQEGIRGDENSPDAFHTTVLPFTRFLAGPADFTFCYPNTSNNYSKNIKVSMGQQLALTVVYFSPLQSIFWYGKPKEYTNEGEIEFFTKVPTVWNESHYLAGEVGKRISVARRNGTTWYMGNAAGFDDWKENLAFNFLRAGKKYTATVYEDDGQGSIRKRIVAVKKGDIFPIDIKAKGGQAIIIRPTN